MFQTILEYIVAFMLIIPMIFSASQPTTYEKQAVVVLVNKEAKTALARTEDNKEMFFNLTTYNLHEGEQIILTINNNKTTTIADDSVKYYVPLGGK